MKQQPNILFLFPDQLRFDWVAPRVPVRTPNLDILRSKGVTFTKAICPSPLCAPSRACLASGREYERCGVPGNGVDYPLDQPTFYQRLRDVGYRVLGCGKFDLHKATLDWGTDGKRLLHEWGFSDGIDNEGKWDGIRSGKEQPKGPYLQFLEDQGLRQVHLDDFAQRGRHSIQPTQLPEEAYCDNWIGRNGLYLLRQVPVGKPWFLQVNFSGPHSPWDITEAMSEWYRDCTFPLPVESSQLSPEKHQAIRRNYSAMVENIDRWVGEFLREVSERGELDNTWVVFSSDHGEMLGDHNMWGKSVPYQPSIGVPLIIAGPGSQKGTVCTLPTTTLDLTATFLEVGGAAGLPEMDSRSLLPLLVGQTDSHRTAVQSVLRRWKVVFDGRFKRVQGFEEDEFLFDLEKDPQEVNPATSTSRGS